MYLSRLYIENFRSIKKLDLRFEKGKNIIVGKNNSGKSNIIKAIDLILGKNSPTWAKSDNISDNDFFEGETEKEIFIWCELKKDEDESLNLSDAKGAFFKLENRFDQTDIKMDVDFSNKDNLFEFSTEDGQARIDTSSELKKKWIGTRSYCNDHGFEDELNDMTNFAYAFRCKKESEGYVKQLVFLYKKEEDTDWFFGINANLRNELLQSAIIPSFRDPKDQLRITNYSWYGKLLREYLKEEDEDLNIAFDKVKDASNKLFEDLQKNISGKTTQIAFPNTKISFQFNPDTKQDIYKSALIYVDDGFNSKLDEKGAGIQSAIIIGLFDYYVRNIAHTNGSLLAIEEPEIYLHPHGRRVISDRLDTFLDGHKNQVILTTHSPEFICSPHEDINLIIVKRDTETSAKNLSFTDIKMKQILIKKQNAEMFFADAVILVEGADKYILESIAEEFGSYTKINTAGTENALGRNWLNDYNVSIINCGGKHEFWKYVKFLNTFDIPWLIIADFDFLRKGLNEFFTKLSYEKEFSDKINSLKSNIAISGKYKSISDIRDGDLEINIKDYISDLSNENRICLLTGELEHFYKAKPEFDKEAGVIETISKSMEEDKTIQEYVEIDEFINALKIFTKKCLNLELIEKNEEIKP
jgi:predicted ATP-dependent endonuclease of OLD family